MLNRQQMMRGDMEQAFLQNKQQEELFMMIMALNNQQQLSENQFQNYQINNGFHHPHFNQNHTSNIGKIGNMNPLQMNCINLPHMTNINPSNFTNINQLLIENINHPILGNHMMDMNCMPNQMQNILQNNQIHNNNQMNFRLNKIYEAKQIQEQNFNSFQDNNLSRGFSIRDSETKKNYDQSDFSNQHEESTTRLSLNMNSFSNQSQQTTQNQQIKQSSDHLSNQNRITQNPSSLQYKKHSENQDSDFTMNANQNGNSVIFQNDQSFNDISNNKIQNQNNKPGSTNREAACGFKFISNAENNNSNLISKIQKNPMISRIADFLTYNYTFQPQMLEQSGVLDEIFSFQQVPQEVKNTKNQKLENNFSLEKNASLNTTVIQLNNKENGLDDPLSNLSTGTYYQQTKSFLAKKEQNVQFNSQSMINKNGQSKDNSLYNQLFFKPISQLQSNTNNNNQMIKQENIEHDGQNNYYNIKKNLQNNNSEHFTQRITQKIEKYMKAKLNQEKNSKITSNIAEKVKSLKGQLEFEDISSIIKLETNINQEKLTNEVQQILHNFKSNHKVYFKKVRSQKEMLKDTKFHNLNKRIMKVLLSILNNPIILSLKVPKPVFYFFNAMSKKLINSSKKLIRSTIVNDQYSHAHYNTMFLQISSENYNKLSQSQSDVDLHKSIYDIDLQLPFSQNYYKIQKTNMIKQYIFLVLDQTLRLNDTSKDTSVQEIRSMYINRVIKGMEKMNEGKIVQRF